jgi:hypothetical protein
MSASLFDFKKYVTPEAIEYYKMRDLLFGDNYQVQNIPKALELAAQCTHPEAVWLTAIFKDKSVSNRHEAKNVLVSYIYRSKTLPREVGKARYFIGGLTSDYIEGNIEGNNENMVALSLGYIPARVNKHSYPHTNNMQPYLEVAVQYGERNAFYFCGVCLQYNQNIQYEIDTEHMRCFEIAYALGCAKSAAQLANYYHQFDMCRWRYLTFAALHNNARHYLEQLDLVIPQDEEDVSNNAELGMFIGKTLNTYYDKNTRLIFGWHASKEKALIIINFYTQQIESCRRAIDAWTQCAWRLGIYKDLRKMIGQLVWNDRDLGLY